MVVNIKQSKHKSTVSLAAVVDTTGKIVAIKTFNTSSTSKQVSYSFCRKGNNIRIFAYDWMPVIEITGKVLKSGIVIVDIERSLSTSLSSLDNYIVTIYKEEMGICTITFDKFCGMVAKDIMAGQRSFVNLDYEVLLKYVKSGGLRDKTVFLSGSPDGIISDKARYVEDFLSALSYYEMFSKAYWQYNQRSDGGNLDTDWLSAEVSPQSPSVLWCPAEMYCPFVRSDFRYYGQRISLKTIFPKYVLNWGISFSEANVELQPPERVLCCSNVALTYCEVQESLCIPYNSAYGSYIYIVGCTKLREMYLSNVNTYKGGYMTTKARHLITVSRSANLERYVLELDLSVSNSLHLDLGMDSLKEIYLLEVGERHTEWLDITWYYPEENKTPCVIYATPLIHATVMRKVGELSKYGIRVVKLERNTAIKFNAKN